VHVTGILVRLVRAIAWTALAVLIALGSAGIVASANQPPGSAGRPELTAAGDAAMEPALDAATQDLATLADEVEALGTTARRALGQVTAGDTASLQETIAQGTALLDRVGALAARLDGSLAAIPYADDQWELHVSAALHRRYDELATVSGVTRGLAGDWAAFTGRSLDAARLGALLARHDEETAAAAARGSDGRYKDAISRLDASDAVLAEARGLRDRLAATTDVATLTAWIDRNADYDAALRDLYKALIASNARVTPAVRRAFEGEQAARAQLPGDTRAVVVIMSDIAQGGLNQAVIAIEEARGVLAQALEVQQQLRDGAGAATPG
jgi:hypothetical protein